MILLVLGMFLVSVTRARFLVQEQSLRITSESLKGTFSSAIANFGIPEYGGSMSGVLVYEDGAKSQACNRALDGISLRAAPGEPPKILLVDRGGLLFSFSV